MYGVARTLLAVGTLSTLLVHDVDALFRPLGVEMSAVTQGGFVLQWSLFALLSGEWLSAAKWIAVGILAISAAGWRPRYLGLLQWWVTASFAASAVVVDGGDQVAAVLTLLLIPITLTDGRRWHWTNPDPDSAASQSTSRAVAGLVAVASLLVIRLQMTVIYLQAAVAKFAVTEWSNGTAVYYWFTHPIFGVPDWMETLAQPLLAQSTIVMAATWGAVLLELILAMGLFMKESYRPYALAAGLAFHGAIAVIHGLFSFFFPMAAGLILYLRAADQPFQWTLPALPVRARALLQRVRNSVRNLPTRSTA